VDSVGALLPFVLILLAFYVLIIRPARKRRGLQTSLQNSLTVGQKIMTTSGMYAEIAAVDDDAVVLETSPGITSRWAKAAVARILTETVPDTETIPKNEHEVEHDTAAPPAEHNIETNAVDPDNTGKRPE
jgi:preprotein translocase subunit YajC